MSISDHSSEPSPSVQQDVLLDTYFVRCHGKAFFILDETTVRQRIQINQIPSYLLYAIYAVSARFVEINPSREGHSKFIGIQPIQMDTMQPSD